ncbi:hypothetical protein Mal65_42990 [Crateriforma conspicua]|nr:hypothetical protein Mal65_42990 [Crateriforma conspicua]
MVASFNALGLLAYYSARALTDLAKPGRGKSWQVCPERFFVVAPLLLSLSLAAQALFLVRVGGLGAVVTKEANLSGMGILFLFSESFPYLLFVSIVLYFRIDGRKIPSGILLGLFLATILLMFAFGGLRGSRSNFLAGVISIATLMHYTQQRIRRRWLIMSAIPIFAFLVVYGVYKSLRHKIVEVESLEEFSEVSSTHNRTWQGMIIGDIGRSSIEAYTLYKLSTGDDYEYAKGSTYLAAVTLLAPRSLRPPLRTSTIAGTDLLYGMGSYTGYGKGAVRSTRIFGVAGEAMLNFGPWFIPVAFFLVGIVMSRSRAFVRNTPLCDMRFLAYPFVFRVLLTIWMLDQANVVFALFKNGAFPLLFVILVSRRQALTNHGIHTTFSGPSNAGLTEPLKLEGQLN